MVRLVSGFFVGFAIVAALLIAGCSSAPVSGQQPVPQDVADAVVVNEQPSSSSSVNSREIPVKVFAWGFDPDAIVVSRGDAVRLMLSSKDTKHGFAINEYGIDVVVSPGKPVPVEFVADKSGEFTAYCSVPCGDGHEGMKLRLIVKE